MHFTPMDCKTNLSSIFERSLVATSHASQDSDLQKSTQDNEWQKCNDKKRKLPAIDEGDDEASANVSKVHDGHS